MSIRYVDFLKVEVKRGCDTLKKKNLLALHFPKKKKRRKDRERTPEENAGLNFSIQSV
jgi:hypothetical protein